MWQVTRNTRDKPMEFHQYVIANDVVEAMQIASYEYKIGTPFNVPILEVRIDRIDEVERTPSEPITTTTSSKFMEKIFV